MTSLTEQNKQYEFFKKLNQQTALSLEHGIKISECNEKPISTLNSMIPTYVIGSVMGFKFVPPDYKGRFLDISPTTESSLHAPCSVEQIKQDSRFDIFKRGKSLNESYVTDCIKNLDRIIQSLNPELIQTLPVIEMCKGVKESLHNAISAYKINLFEEN